MTGAGEQVYLAGYFPKPAAVPAGWPAAARVDEICSVSTCLNAPPAGWIRRWLHNDLGFFNTRVDARAVGPGLPLFAYRLWPFLFVEGRLVAQPVLQLEVEPLSADFVSLGFDAVSRSTSTFFECSPLSCNIMATEIPVNRFCLMDSLPEAAALAERFSRGNQEPGPYHVLEVLREQPPAPG
jgi:hypothetical protein